MPGAGDGPSLTVVLPWRRWIGSSSLLRALFGGISVGEMDCGSSLRDLDRGSSSLLRALLSGNSVGEMDCGSSLWDLDFGYSSLSRKGLVEDLHLVADEGHVDGGLVEDLP